MAGKKTPAPTKSGKGGAGKSTNSISSRNQKQSAPRVPSQSIENRESEDDLRRQQALLNIFSSTFRDVLEAEDFSSQLQEVKAALFSRDFEGAFAREAALDVYAARWSPTRALCYAHVLRRLDSHLRSLASATSACGNCSSHGTRLNSTSESQDDCKTRGSPRGIEQDEKTANDETDDIEATIPEEPKASASPEKREASAREQQTQTQPLRILAIGGAAAEIVAFADYISAHTTSSSTPHAEITLLDIGPWNSIVSRLHTALTTLPPLSRYASAAARNANKALVSPTSFQCRFLQKDVLSLEEKELAELVKGAGVGLDGLDAQPTPTLITLLFTLNELYTTSGIKRTTSFLRLLSALAAPGTLLLVIDSPGSYSEAAVGKGAKRYPMQWLLDHTLIPPPSNPRRQKSGSNAAGDGGDGDGDGNGNGNGVRRSDVKWEKLESHDSVWFRVVEGLCYPIPLENMRYQMHLYRASTSRETKKREGE
ncbi:hypothetical protein F5Y01DRAFT_284655 [Xylaria sp. FL0043]|nr:hypothetical protein F5Y01DRAFT_284655 [Xylaria sp. FL0043]